MEMGINSSFFVNGPKSENMEELRIKIDLDGRLDWMFCERLKSIQDLKDQIADKYRFGEWDGFFLLKDGAKLPKREDIRLLSNGDTVRICMTEDFDLENYY